jgi:ACS family hexuronate transporter-like MFS transporter
MTLPGSSGEPAVGKTGNYRWTVCALLFFATTVNYIDRQVLGLLAPTLEKEIGWSEIEYGYIVVAFQAAYAIGLIFFGRLIDRYGTKIGYSISIVVWSIAAMAHALATSAFGFGAARFALGVGESGNFPAAIKAVAEWFPKKQRALATGIFNSGANIGAVVAPAVVPWITITYGWPAAFVATGALGFLWLIAWGLMYERPEVHKRVSKSELAYIQSDEPEPPAAKVPWVTLMKYPQTWSFILGKFLTDPIWWFYLYWLPKFLNKTYGLTITDLGLPLIVIYMMTSIGSIGGGWLSGALLSRGWSVNAGRKVTMLICAALVVPIVVASQVSDLWVAVLLIGLAAAAHQGWSANLFTTVSDMFPKHAVGSVVGYGGMAGAVGGMVLSATAGYVLEFTGSYLSLFILAGSIYLFSLLIIHLLVPKMKPVVLPS